MSIYRRVLRYYRPFLWQTIFGLFLALLGVGLNLLKPWPFKIIVDDFLRAGPTIRPDWRKWVLLLCLALIEIHSGTRKRCSRSGAGRPELDPNGARVRARGL